MRLLANAPGRRGGEAAPEAPRWRERLRHGRRPLGPRTINRLGHASCPSLFPIFLPKRYLPRIPVRARSGVPRCFGRKICGRKLKRPEDLGNNLSHLDTHAHKLPCPESRSQIRGRLWTADGADGRGWESPAFICGYRRNQRLIPFPHSWDSSDSWALLSQTCLPSAPGSPLQPLAFSLPLFSIIPTVGFRFAGSVPDWPHAARSSLNGRSRWSTVHRGAPARPGVRRAGTGLWPSPTGEVPTQLMNPNSPPQPLPVSTPAPDSPRPGAPRTRGGKIARLPRAVRDQLNLRLLDNEPAPSLVAWLNSLPEVQSRLAALFAFGPPPAPAHLPCAQPQPCFPACLILLIQWQPRKTKENQGKPNRRPQRGQNQAEGQTSRWFISSLQAPCCPPSAILKTGPTLPHPLRRFSPVLADSLASNGRVELACPWARAHAEPDRMT